MTRQVQTIINVRHAGFFLRGDFDRQYGLAGRGVRQNRPERDTAETGAHASRIV